MRILALLVVLLLPSVAWAQVGFLQAVPGTPRPTCTSIPSPVKNQTWCADAENGPGSYLWKVWNGVSYVTVGGGASGGPGGPNMSIQFNDSATFNGDAQLEWNKTTKQLLVPGIQYLSTGTANVSPVLISRFTHVAPTEPEVGNMLVQSATTPATDVHVILGAFDMISTTGSFASGKLHRDRVALYSGIHGSTNSGNIWSYNSDTLMLPGSGDYFAQGAEIDFTNNNVDRGDADGELGLQGFFAAPLFFDSLSTKRSTAGIFFSGLNSPKMWNRGIVFAFDAISATGSTFQDSTNGLKSVDIRGHPTFGIYQNPDVPGLPVTRNFFAGGVDLVGSSLRLFEPNYVFHVDIGASTGLAQDMLYLWPSVPGAFGNCLITDGSAGFQTLSWGACGGGAVSSVTGTASQITASPTTGAVILSLPSPVVTPGGLTVTSLAGTGVRCVHVDNTGELSVASGDCATGGSGSVTSVGLTMPSVFSVAGSPVTTAGTLAVTLATELANTLFAGPPSGGAAIPTFRALVAADLPAGTGTVTSVAQTVPVEFSVAGSPITTSGTLAITKATQTANTIWAGPTAGGAVVPTFRALVTADLPSGTGTVTSVSTTSPLTGGPITSSGAVECPTCVTSASALTANRLVLGNGGQSATALGSLGTSTTVLHGNAGGAPSFGAVNLATDVTGSLPTGAAPACATQSHIPVGYPLVFGGAATSNPGGTAGQLVCYRFQQVCQATNYTKMAFRVVGAGGAGSQCQVGIYSADGTTTVRLGTVQTCTGATTTQSDTGLTAFNLDSGGSYLFCLAASTPTTPTFAATTVLTTAFWNVFNATSYTGPTTSTAVAQFNNACTAGSTPYACCSGVGTGSCTGMPSSVGTLTAATITAIPIAIVAP